MNRLRIIPFFLLTTFSFLYPLSPEQIRQNYSLMIKAHDPVKGLCLAIVHGEQLLDEDPIIVPDSSFKYGRSEWNELCAMWEDVKKPEDVGCHTLRNNFVDVDNGNIICSAHISQQGDALDFRCNFIIDRTMQFKQAMLVLNDFVEECEFRQKELEEEKKIPIKSCFSDLDIDFNEKEIASYQQSKPPAKIIVYARQIGVGILMRYLALKNYMVDNWVSVKNKFFV